MRASDIRSVKLELCRRVFPGVFEPRGRRGRRGASRAWSDVLGIGIGEKLSGNGYTGELCLIAYVKRKRPLRDLPRGRRLPAHCDGLPTDVVETGRIRALQDLCAARPDSRQARPFPAGVSVGGGDNAAGTVGCLVRRLDDGRVCVLSNYHVLADLDDPGSRLPAFQPGFGDGRVDPGDRIGTLVDGTPLDFSGAPNLMDAAIAAVDAGLVRSEICGVGAIQGTAGLAHNDSVMMFGKRSRFVRGFVKDLDCTIEVSYGRRKAILVNQVRILPVPPQEVFARGGDSGALVLKDGGRAAALLFAADIGEGAGYATPIGAVLGRLNLTIV